MYVVRPWLLTIPLCYICQVENVFVYRLAAACWYKILWQQEDKIMPRIEILTLVC